MINTKKTLLLPILLSLISCFKGEQNCNHFKTGKFEFVQEINGVKKTTVFDRNDSIQIEIFEGKTDTATVRWVNDCEFILQKLHPKNRMEQKAISMRILTTTQKSYTFEYSFVDEEKKQQGSATKLE
jgi:hypothetical protein